MAATVQNGRQDVVEGTPFDLGASQGSGSKRRVSEMLVGTFLVAVFALAGAWFYATSTQSTGYLALRNEVSRGQEITAADLAVVEISAESPIRVATATDRELVVGKIALTDMAVGTLVSQDQLVESARIPSGEGIVGLSLSPGEYPSRSLRPGDLVRVVVMPAVLEDLAEADVTVVAEQATVVEIAETGGTELFVSLTLASEQADLVAVADSQNRVRLIQVSEG